MCRGQSLWSQEEILPPAPRGDTVQTFPSIMGAQSTRLGTSADVPLEATASVLSRCPRRDCSPLWASRWAISKVNHGHGQRVTLARRLLPATVTETLQVRRSYGPRLCRRLGDMSSAALSRRTVLSAGCPRRCDHSKVTAKGSRGA